MLDWTVKNKDDKFFYDLIENTRDCHLSQYVDEVTRFRDGSVRNVLDLIFSNVGCFTERIQIKSRIGKRDYGCIRVPFDITTQI